MTDRKPALTKHRFVGVEGRIDGDRTLFYPATFSEREWVLASDLPPAILNLTAPELAALAVFAEAMPELLEDPWAMSRCPGCVDRGPEEHPDCPGHTLLEDTIITALAAAKSTTAEEGTNG